MSSGPRPLNMRKPCRNIELRCGVVLWPSQVLEQEEEKEEEQEEQFVEGDEEEDSEAEVRALMAWHARLASPQGAAATSVTQDVHATQCAGGE